MDRVWGQWQGDNRFQIHLPSDLTVVSGEGNPRPVDMVLSALLACSGGTFVKVLSQMRLSVEGVRIAVDAERDAEPPRVFTSIRIRWQIWPGRTPEGRIRVALDLADKYCSILNLLRRACPVETHVLVHPPGEPATVATQDPGPC